MNPSQKGWLKEFLNYRKHQFIRSKELEKKKIGQNPDQSFYSLIQPTGIMYGYPIHFYDLDVDTNWSRLDTVKVLLADSFINISALYNDSPVETEDDFYNMINKTMDSLMDFYNGVYPELAVSMTNWVGKKKDMLAVTEKLLEKRVGYTFKKSSNFWTEFFHNSQLFLDIYIFGQWSYTQPDRILLDFFKQEKEDLSYTAVKVMAAAAHANKHIEHEEKTLFEHFIESSGLPPEKKRVAYEYFEHGLAIQDIQLDGSDPWVIRKYFLELAILTVWADKKIEEMEWSFLDNFNRSLGFSEEDFNNSVIAVEGFVLENWVELESLNAKKDHYEISSDYIARLAKVAAKYSSRIKLDIIAQRDLHQRLKKGNAAELSPEDKEDVRKHFLAILKAIPSFRIIALPTDFLTYEMLLQIIPKDVMNELLND